MTTFADTSALYAYLDRAADNHSQAADLVFVDDDTHHAAITGYRAGLRRRTSLVDHGSFEVMRRAGLPEAFAFDDDFTRQGFTLVS